MTTGGTGNHFDLTPNAIEKKTRVQNIKEVTPDLDALSEYLLDNQSDNVAKKIHPSP